MKVSTPIGVTLELPSGWFDVTDDLEGDDMPFTLGHENGSGALQFSVGVYRSGAQPDPSPEDLTAMLAAFAATHSLGTPTDCIERSDPIRLAAATFRPGDFVRVWYVSDRWSIALITFTSIAEPPSSELSDCECIVNSIRFQSSRDGEQTHGADAGPARS